MDQRSKDYSEIAASFRPGHADFTYDAKYGIRDPRGGGRSSARETAMRVAAGAIARKVVPGMRVRGALVQMGPHKIDRRNWNWDEVDRNPFFCPDAQASEFFAEYLDGIRKSGSSIGAVLEIVAEGVPAGLGAPIYGKLDSDIASALMSINAVKGVESVRALARRNSPARKTLTKSAWAMTASRFPREPCGRHSRRHFHRPADCGALCREATSSILTPRATIDRYGNETEIRTKGRHDPCVGIRAVPVGEAMLAIVLADHYLRHRGQVG